MEDIVLALIWCEQLQAFLRRKLKIDAHAVGKPPELIEQFRRSAGNGLRMDVAAEAVFFAQDAQCFDHEFGSEIRASDNA